MQIEGFTTGKNIQSRSLEFMRNSLSSMFSEGAFGKAELPELVKEHSKQKHTPILNCKNRNDHRILFPISYDSMVS